MNQVKDFLVSHGIGFVLHEHPAVFTCEEAERYCGDLPGIASKNLFLKNKQASRFFLLILPATKKADLGAFCTVVNEGKVTFASAEELQEILGLTPGAVSPFGLINDEQKRVEVLVDPLVYNAEIVTFHPNRNTASLELSKEMFHKFLQTVGNKTTVMDAG